MPTLKYRQDGNDYREYTEAEYAQDEIDAKQIAAQAKAEADKAIAKQALLDRLGITADEAALLLG